MLPKGWEGHRGGPEKARPVTQRSPQTVSDAAWWLLCSGLPSPLTEMGIFTHDHCCVWILNLQYWAGATTEAQGLYFKTIEQNSNKAHDGGGLTSLLVSFLPENSNLGPGKML